VIAEGRSVLAADMNQGPSADRRFVEELRIRDYGCIQDATFRFSRLHALIGPNDSGKSTVLRALRTLSFVISGEITEGQQGTLLRAVQMSKGEGPRFEVSASTATWAVDFTRSGSYGWGLFTRGRVPEARPEKGAKSSSFGPASTRPTKNFKVALQNAQVLRLEPEALRAPHSLIPDSEPLRFVDERGTGLPALYDALLTRELRAYQAINGELSRLFPDVESIRLVTVDRHTKGIGVKLVDGTFVPADLMSEGLLFYLAFAVLPYLAPTSLLLVEEPENGLHPARIAEVVGVLRAISRTTQVILATHSPLVVNELQPDEVTLVTRSREHGTRATLLKDVPRLDKRAKGSGLGDLWLSHADGKEEGRLFEGNPRS
jgi:energy-coupling factor transporter ATP-binding protein EcfA2